ncbi:MAG: histidine phosphatase family protein [Micromonosporaceae bacterium]|nr:histidine phosphatase family protein [Micromonosporaceae bacterium]
MDGPAEVDGPAAQPAEVAGPAGQPAPGPPTRLIIWRHGQTAWNVEDRIQGQLDIDLDETGVAQARAAAARLATVRIDAIVSSDLGRVTRTVDELVALTGLPVRLDRRLRERNFGEWQGLTGLEVPQRYPEQSVRWRAGEPIGDCGVEELDELAKRVTEALHDAAALAPGGTVVVGTHGAAAKYGVAGLLGWPAAVIRTFGTLGNCHWTELRFDRVRGWLLRSHNLS